jgi:hypothetical protein
MYGLDSGRSAELEAELNGRHIEFGFGFFLNLNEQVERVDYFVVDDAEVDQQLGLNIRMIVLIKEHSSY